MEEFQSQEGKVEVVSAPLWSASGRLDSMSGGSVLFALDVFDAKTIILSWHNHLATLLFTPFGVFPER